MIYPGTYQSHADQTIDIEMRKTQKGLGPNAFRVSERDEESREEEHWVALVQEGLVCLDTVPTLAIPRESVRWTAHDDVEVHALLRTDAGCTLHELLEGGTFPESEMVRAMCRLVRKGVIRIT
jgi:hypothetical protein